MNTPVSSLKTPADRLAYYFTQMRALEEAWGSASNDEADALFTTYDEFVELALEEVSHVTALDMYLLGHAHGYYGTTPEKGTL